MAEISHPLRHIPNASKIDTKYCDLTLKCKGREFKVHKVIVCYQSPVLAAACDGEFQESITGVINIGQFDAKTIEHMVEFMYTGNYSNDGANPEVNMDVSETASNAMNASAATILRHVRVNAAADYYDLPQLREFANTKIRRILETSWSPDGFPGVVEEVYNSTSDEELRRLVCKSAAEHIEELLDIEAFAALEFDPDFTLGVTRYMSAAYRAEKNAATEELRELRRRLESVTTKYEDTARRDDQIRDCLNRLNRTSSCRNSTCNAEFLCLIEENGTSFDSTFLLRCAKCRCKHT